MHNIVVMSRKKATCILFLCVNKKKWSKWNTLYSSSQSHNPVNQSVSQSVGQS